MKTLIAMQVKTLNHLFATVYARVVLFQDRRCVLEEDCLIDSLCIVDVDVDVKEV